MQEINVVNEDHKIEEAQYFLNRLSDPQLEIREFSFELSVHFLRRPDRRFSMHLKKLV